MYRSCDTVPSKRMLYVVEIGENTITELLLLRETMGKINSIGITNIGLLREKTNNFIGRLV